jgi:hypothetical protein
MCVGRFCLFLRFLLDFGTFSDSVVFCVCGHQAQAGLIYKNLTQQSANSSSLDQKNS